jgi:hypothetical protein
MNGSPGEVSIQVALAGLIQPVAFAQQIQPVVQ